MKKKNEEKNKNNNTYIDNMNNINNNSVLKINKTNILKINNDTDKINNKRKILKKKTLDKSQKLINSYFLYFNCIKDKL